MYEVTVQTTPKNIVVVSERETTQVSSTITSFSAAVSNINPTYVPNDTVYYATGATFSGARFTTPLASGVEYQYISFPFVLTQFPSSVVCDMENNVDNIIYSHVINGVNNSGFGVYFSDYLSFSGYKLHVTVNI